MKNGLEDVTTEEIAVASGVSTRSFFNYYPNKEAAAIGHPPRFSEAELDGLLKGTGPLVVDLKRLLDGRMEVLSKNEDIVRMVAANLRANEKVRAIFDVFLMAE